MRYANILIQQADLVVCLGTRLGLQQTGFNWQQFAPLAEIVQIDLDEAELTKGHPRVAMSICADADQVLARLSGCLGAPRSESQKRWLEFCSGVKAKLPLSEESNSGYGDRVNPYDFYRELSLAMPEDCILVPSSSGSSFTCAYQSVLLRRSHRMLSNKSQASMGYGLSGAIGAALGNPKSEVFLVEGDGGFLQNAQELAVARRQNLSIKMFLWVNGGYASIRMTQKRYFGGAWIGCDEKSGLGFPDWASYFESFGIPTMEMKTASFADSGVSDFIASEPLCAVLVQIHPEQTFYPKIDSRVTSSGSMESNPLHLIGPALDPEQYREVCPYLPAHNS
jgi:acetolactate synthase-1/2/3 large subunit